MLVPEASVGCSSLGGSMRGIIGVPAKTLFVMPLALRHFLSVRFELVIGHLGAFEL